MATSTGFVVDSLKHPAEIERLRAVYRPDSFVLGIYAPPAARFRKIMDDAIECGEKPTNDEIERLMRRDEDEQHPHGQRVRKAFEMSDR